MNLRPAVCFKRSGIRHSQYYLEIAKGRRDEFVKLGRASLKLDHIATLEDLGVAAGLSHEQRRELVTAILRPSRLEVWPRELALERGMAFIRACAAANSKVLAEG